MQLHIDGGANHMQGSVYDVDFSRVSGQIASASKDKTIRLWQPTVYAAIHSECCTLSAMTYWYLLSPAWIHYLHT